MSEYALHTFIVELTRSVMLYCSCLMAGSIIQGISGYKRKFQCIEFLYSVYGQVWSILNLNKT